MKRASSISLVLVIFLSLVACAGFSSNKEVPVIRLPIGVDVGIHDALCDDVKGRVIPEKLKTLDIPFEWTNQIEGLLSVGPITEESEDVYSRIRQAYFLKIICDDELTTSISGEVILEGLNASGQWVGINDTATIEHYSMQFLQKLDL